MGATVVKASDFDEGLVKTRYSTLVAKEFSLGVFFWFIHGTAAGESLPKEVTVL